MRVADVASPIARARANRYRSRIEERCQVYRTSPPDPERRAQQLDLLNAEWARVVREVPRFRRLRSEGLPGRFDSLEEFVECVPTMSRGSIQQDKGALTSESRKPEWMRITGGSTAQPVQMPAWKRELEATNPDMWAARSWYGISPTSRLFLLWGHSHLLGTGVAGWLRGRRREIADRLLGYLRFSAYDLRPEHMDAAARELLRFRPEYLLGYSVALDVLARTVAPAHREALRGIGVKVVVGAAESFPAPDSVSRLSDLFDCPVAMEYGSVETNLVAHTHPDGGYRVFWRSYLVEADGPDTRPPLRVTSLYPRAVPLVRYEIGDEIELWDPADARIGVTSFRRVLGRCNDYVLLPGGRPVHSEAITHAVRPCEAVRSYQVVQEGDRCELRYTADRPLTSDEEATVRRRLGRIEPGLERIPLTHVRELERTIAGKTPMILRRRGA